jgi:hypothetical protein
MANLATVSTENFAIHITSFASINMHVFVLLIFKFYSEMHSSFHFLLIDR